jgi:hypothetical protein
MRMLFSGVKRASRPVLAGATVVMAFFLSQGCGDALSAGSSPLSAKAYVRPRQRKD